jgi:hypothetical protein
MQIKDEMPAPPQDDLMEGDAARPQNRTDIRKESLRFHASAWRRLLFLFFDLVALTAFGLAACADAFPSYVRIVAGIIALACLRLVPCWLFSSGFRLTIDEAGIRQKLPLAEFFVPWEAARSATLVEWLSFTGERGQPFVRIRLAPNASQKCIVTAKGDRRTVADKEDPHLDVVGDLWGISPSQLLELINARFAA